MDGVLYSLIIQALRTLLVAVVPIVAAVALVGVVSSALQAAFSVSEPAAGYAARLAAVVAVLYFSLPSIIELFRALATYAFQGG